MRVTFLGALACFALLASGCGGNEARGGGSARDGSIDVTASDGSSGSSSGASGSGSGGSSSGSDGNGGGDGSVGDGGLPGCPSSPPLPAGSPFCDVDGQSCNYPDGGTKWGCSAACVCSPSNPVLDAGLEWQCSFTPCPCPPAPNQYVGPCFADPPQCDYPDAGCAGATCYCASEDIYICDYAPCPDAGEPADAAGE